MSHFATHEWVADITELHSLGVSAAAVSRARRSGVVVAIAPRVVAVRDVELTLRGRARAAVLSAGAEAFVSGPTAGALIGMRGMPRDKVEVTVHERRRVHLPPWVTLRRTSWIDEDRDVTDDDGLRVASPLRVLFGLARQFSAHRFERAAEDLWHLGLVTPADADQYLEAVRRSGNSGVTRFERWLERALERDRPSQSGLELDVLDAVRRAGLPEPVRQHPLRLTNGEVIHLDLAWPELRLALEPGHSWWHGGDLMQRRDAARDRACGEVGWAVHRFDEVQVQARAELVRSIAAIYRARLALLGRRRADSPDSA